MIKLEFDIEDKTLFLMRNGRGTNVQYKNIINLYFSLKRNEWFNNQKKVGSLEVVFFIIRILPKILKMKFNKVKVNINDFIAFLTDFELLNHIFILIFLLILCINCLFVLFLGMFLF